MVSIKQLEQQIARERSKLRVEDNINKELTRKRKLQTELIKLRQRKIISVGAKAKRISGRFGKALLKVGKKAVPVIKKQAGLIRQQQLRDNKIAAARSKRAPKKRRKSSVRNNAGSNMFSNLDF